MGRGNLPPWVRLKQRRLDLGMTQACLSNGLVTQSMLSHIESGRIIPSEATLRTLAERLGWSTVDMVREWAGVRESSKIRQRLWDAVVTGQDMEVCNLLRTHSDCLLRFERYIHQAWAAAMHAELDAVEFYLQQAWLTTGSTVHDGRRGPIATTGYESPWNRHLESRMLVLDAWVRMWVCQRTDRAYAADYWIRKLQLRQQRCLRADLRRLAAAAWYNGDDAQH